MKRFALKQLWLLLLATILLAACGGEEVIDPEVPAEEPVAETVEEPVEEMAEEPVEEMAEESTEEFTEEPMEEPPEAEMEVESAVLRIGRSSSMDTLNPGASVTAAAHSVFNLVYDTLYQIELDGTFSLELAERVDVSDDGLVWTFIIRDGVIFHDGEPLTAEDVAFSLDLYATQEDFPILSGYTGFFESVEAPDERTVVLTLTDAIPNFESQLYLLYVLPEHIWGELDRSTLAEFENKEMIGSGPFSLVEYAQDEFVRLAAVKDHYLMGPQIDEVIFQMFESPDGLVQALRTGQIDMITEMPKTAVPTLRNESNIAVVTGPPLLPRTTDIAINQATADICPEGSVCSGHPALQDRNVRLAMSHATDKQQLIDVIQLGLGTVGTTLIPDGLGVFYNSELQPYVFDIAMANQILDDAGYLDTDDDGIREMPDGSQPLTFRVYWPNDFDSAARMAEMLGDMWGQIGIGIEPQALDVDALLSVCCPTLDYDIMIWWWEFDPDPSFALSLMITDEIDFGNNETAYSNSEYDALFQEQAVELDSATRQEIIWEMQRIVHEDIPYIIPYYDQAVQAYRTDSYIGWQTNAGKIVLEGPSSLLVVEPVR